MFWREHSYVAYSTTYVGYLTLRRKSAFLCRKKISCFHNGIEYAGEKVGSNITQAKCLLKVWTGQLCPNRVDLVLPGTMNEQD